MMYRMMVYPSEENGPKVFYERLLPYLNSKPLMANIDPKRTAWRIPPHGNDTSHCQCDTAFGMCVQCSDRMRGHAKTVNPASTRQ